MRRYVLFFLFMPVIVLAEPQSPGQITFQGGLNLLQPPTQIDDSESPEMYNCSPSLAGAMTKRNGSKRFISQAFSSNPITSLQRVYASSGAIQFKGLIAGSKDAVIYSSQDINPVWIKIATQMAHNQNYSFVQMGNKILIAGDRLLDNVKAFDIPTSSMSDAFDIGATTDSINPRGKYQLVASNYYLLGNVIQTQQKDPLLGPTTYYPGRLFFSRLNKFSSMTASRFIEFKTNEELTGLGSVFDGRVNVFYPTSIGEIQFTVLDLPSSGGDFTTQMVVTGFGCIAPKTLVNTGSQNGLYCFLAKDGVRLWDGGRQSRLNVGESSRIISGKIRPLIEQLINSGNYKNAVGFYYPKKEWYIFSFELPTKYPKGKNNYTLVYDFKTDTWWPFCNWLASAYASADNQADTGQGYYADSADGYVHLFDLEGYDDSRKEIVFDTMDSTWSWSGSSQNVVDVLEGTASLKMNIGKAANIGDIVTATMTRIDTIQFGEWRDKTKVTLNDKLSFKVFGVNIASITSFRLDFEINSVTDTFDTNFTSVTFSSNIFQGGDKWITIEIPISSFPFRSDWTDLSIESVPYASQFNLYGARFVLSGIYFSSVSIDDMRIVGEKQNPIKMSRTTKLFDFRNSAFKSAGTVLVTREKSPDASFSMDVYNDFGQKLRTEVFEQECPKEVVIFRYPNNPGFAILDSTDFSIKKVTSTIIQHWNCLNGTADNSQIVCGDRTNNRLLSFKRSDLSTFSATYGEFGSGTSNFNLIHEIAETPNGYVISDLKNQRIKLHSSASLEFLKQYGSLGTQTTSFHQPTGVTSDESNFFISDESNKRITQTDQSTFGIKAQLIIDLNTNSDTSLASDDKNLYLFYNKASDTNNDSQDVFLDVRDKGDLSLAKRYQIMPLNVSTGSYQTMGSIGLLGRYVFIPFANVDANGNTHFYIQKRLKSTGDIVLERAFDKRFISAVGFSPSYKPLIKTESKDLKVEGRYIQMRFYDNSLDNYWRIYSIAPLVSVQPLTY